MVLPHSSVLDIPVTSVGGYAGMVGNRQLRSYDARTDQQRPDLTLSRSVKSVAYDEGLGTVAAIAGNDHRSDPPQGRWWSAGWHTITCT